MAKCQLGRRARARHRRMERNIVFVSRASKHMGDPTATSRTCSIRGADALSDASLGHRDGCSFVARAFDGSSVVALSRSLHAQLRSIDVDRIAREGLAVRWCVLVLDRDSLRARRHRAARETRVRKRVLLHSVNATSRRTDLDAPSEPTLRQSADRSRDAIAGVSVFGHRGGNGALPAPGGLRFGRSPGVRTARSLARELRRQPPGAAASGRRLHASRLPRGRAR